MARTDRASRLIRATPMAIYDAFVDPEALATWLPPEGMTGTIEAFQPRAGGRYRIRLVYQDADATHGKTSAGEDVVEGRFLALVPGEKIVQEAVFESDDPAFAGTMTMTWHLLASAGGTEVAIVAENVPEGISKPDHDAGMKSSLANLARFVE